MRSSASPALDHLDVGRLRHHRYASRAFAFYDALQSAIAAMAMQRAGARDRAAFFGFMAVLGLAIVLFGIPAE